MTPAVELSIILPAYNEGREIIQTITALKRKLNTLNIDYEILIVNDGSKDDTLERARSCEGEAVKVLTYAPNKGKGAAIRHGMLQACGRYRLFMDVDLSTSLEAIGQFLEIMRGGGCDVLIGDRKSRKDRKIDQPWVRRFFGRGFTILSGWCAGRAFADFTCGFKMFNANAAEIIFSRQRINNWSFDTEILHIACRHRLKILEVSVEWTHNAGSNVRVLRDIMTSLYGLMKIRWHAFTGAYR